MLYQIISLLLEVVTGVVGGSCLLRLYMQQQRIPMSARSGNPLGRFVFALTDWLVLPLRRPRPPFIALVISLALKPAFLMSAIIFTKSLFSALLLSNCSFFSSAAFCF